jgi:hypothetical protein
MIVSGSGVGLLVVMITILGAFYLTSQRVVPSASGGFMGMLFLSLLALVALIFLGLRGGARASF